MQHAPLIRLIVAILSVGALVSPCAHAQTAVVPASITAQLDRMRRHWPQVAQPQLQSGPRIEYRDGAIRIGTVTLDELTRTPQNARGAVLAFLLGHEAWHSVQAKQHAPAEIEQLRASQMLECEADFMGGAAAWRELSAQLDPHQIDNAHHDLLSWLRAHANLATNDGSYPPPAERVWATEIGWGQAEAPALIRYVGRAPVQSESERARDACLKVIRDSDGSLDELQFFWNSTPARDSGEPAKRPTVTFRLEAINKSQRAIIANVLALESRDSRVWDVVDEALNLPPGQKVQRDVVFKNISPDGIVDDRSYFFTFIRAPQQPFISKLVSSRYADSNATQPSRLIRPSSFAEPGYCIDRVKIAAADSLFLSRIANVVAASEEDFLAIRDGPGATTQYYTKYPMLPGVGMSLDDYIVVFSGPNSSAVMTVPKSAQDADSFAQFARLAALLRRVCGAESVKEEGPSKDDDSLRNRHVVIERLAPNLFLTMDILVDDDDKTPAAGSITIGIGHNLKRASH